MTTERIAVAMSGGVDSSVAAHLLKEAGHDLIGLSIGSRFPAHAQELENARRAADKLNIPLEVIDLTDGFARLLDYFCNEYLAGRTPNPCVRCNTLLKFGLLLDAARQLDCSALATGHYVRRERIGKRWALKRGRDAKKDQSYFLFGLSQNQIESARFPLGELSKPDVRRIASEFGLHVRDKTESQEICMAPDDDYGVLLRQHCADRLVPGEIVDTTGRILGQHDGIAFYTIGQRRGLGVAAGKPLYVVRLESASNRVVLGPEEALYSRELLAECVNWVSIEPPSSSGGPQPAQVRIRYRHAGAAAELVPKAVNSVRVVFDEPQRAITSGQAAVFYDDDVLLGGGWIA